MRRKKSWREKLADSKGLPKTVPISGKMKERCGPGRLVIPAPMEVDEIMRAVPRSKLTTIDEIRTALAKKHGVNFACPMCTGIFAWIAAHARQSPKKRARKRSHPIGAPSKAAAN